MPNVPQGDLDALLRFTDKIRNADHNIGMMLAAGNRQAARDAVKQLHDASIAARKLLVNLGAADGAETMSGTDVRLEHLDTPANRRYLAALEEAFAAGVAVDRERGIMDAGPSDILDMLAEEVRMEIYGPADLREGADR